MEVHPRLLQVARRAEEVRTAGEPLAGIERLVVVRHDRLGDVVLTLPAIDALRRTYPQAELALVVAPAVRPLAEQVEGIEHVFEAGPDAGGLRRRLQEFAADLVVCISRGAAFAWATTRAGVRHRVGPGFRYYSPLFGRTVDEHRSPGTRHEAEYSLSYAHRCGATAAAPRFQLCADPESEEAIEDWLRTRGVGPGFVVLHAGSGGSCPRWPIEHFLRLSALLADRELAVVFTVGPGDTAVEEALASLPERRRKVFHGGLPQLRQLLERAAVVVGSSTGPIHLAAARGTPTLAIHAPWPTCGVSRWGPYDAGGWGVVAHVDGADSWSHRDRARRAGALMAGVPAELVRDAVCALHAGRSPA